MAYGRKGRGDDLGCGAKANGDDMNFEGQSILITGGTGSLGVCLVEKLLRDHKPRKVIVFSRDEVKQHDLRARFPESDDSPIRYFIGNIRDRDRLMRALHGVDLVIHAAALKQVPTAEYNPLEVIQTNVLGAANLIDAAIDRGVGKIVALSTDKAVNPVNLYGATKLCSDKLFIAAGVYAGETKTRFSVVRYGNVCGSRGSVVPLFRRLAPTGVLPITDVRMTRFWVTIEDAADFVLDSANRMEGGEIFLPKLPSMKITDLARVIAPECEQKEIGIRPGEKLHEVLITEDEARRTIEFKDHYVVGPGDVMRNFEDGHLAHGKLVPDNFRYSSDNNTW